MSAVEQYILTILAMFALAGSHHPIRDIDDLVVVLSLAVAAGLLIALVMRWDKQTEEKRREEIWKERERKRLLLPTLGNLKVLVSKAIIREVGFNEYDSMTSRLFHSQYYPETFSLILDREEDEPTLFRRGHLEVDDLSQIKYGDYVSENGVISIRVYASVTQRSQLRLISGD